MSHNHTTPTHPPIYIDVSLNGAEHTMELDTGSARTIISENTYRNLWNKPPRGGGGGVYTILVIGDWPVLFLVKRELAIFKNVNCDWINSGDW